MTRYRSPYFQHIFAGGYSAGYYSYIWSEVLDTDAFQAFKEKGIFDPATARSFRTNILERGGTRRRHGDVQSLPRPGAFGRAAAGETRPEELSEA